MTVDEERQDIVIRTNNHKYFKRIQLRDLTDRGIALEADSIEWAYDHHALTIRYDKPYALRESERNYMSAAIIKNNLCNCILSD